MAKKASKRSAKAPKTVESLTHTDAKRRNIPTAELESVMGADDRSPIRVAYERRNRDLDPQLVWRGKDEQDWSDLVVNAPPLFIQEKVHPKVLIDDLVARSASKGSTEQQLDLFADFNGLPTEGRGLYYVRYLSDFPARPLTNLWTDTQPGSVFSGADERLYVVQTTQRVVERCLLMTTDPGDLILDPTCGSGTTAYVAEQ